jgi:hypothetical protein
MPMVDSDSIDGKQAQDALIDQHISEDDGLLIEDIFAPY